MAERDDGIGELRNAITQSAAEERHAQQRERAEKAHQNVFEEQALRTNFHGLFGVATIEATNRGSSTVEAEHLLLAALFDRKSGATAAAAAHGLSYESFTEALRAERERTLAGIGIALPSPDRLKAAPRVRAGRPRFGASAREAWERMGRATRGRRGGRQRITSADFVIGLLGAELGTVPRALALAGIDRTALLHELAELTAGPPRTGPTPTAASPRVAGLVIGSLGADEAEALLQDVTDLTDRATDSAD